MAILDAILKFQPYEPKPCSNLIVFVIQPLNIHKSQIESVLSSMSVI